MPLDRYRSRLPQIIKSGASILAIAMPLIVASSCDQFQQKYIRQDRLFKIAFKEDAREGDTIAINQGVMSDPDPEIRRRAALAIGRIGGDYYLPILSEDLRDTVQSCSEAKFFAAGLLGDSSLIEPLLMAARGDGPARDAAVEALGRIFDSTRASDLAHFLDDPDTLVVYQATLALWRSKGWSEASRIAALGISTTNRKIRYGALYALSRGRRPEGKEFFQLTLSDSDPEYRMLAYLGLGRIGDSASLEAVALGIDDSDPRVVASAIMALGELGDSGVRMIASRLILISDEKSLELAIQIIGDKKYGEAIDDLTSSLRSDKRENILAAAAKALLQIKKDAAVPLVGEALSTPTSWQRTKIAEGLAAGGPEGVGILRVYLNDTIPIVRATALEAICSADSMEALSYLRAALDDSDFVIVATAVTLASQKQTLSLIPKIAGLYLSQRGTLDPDAKRSIIDALGAFKPDSASDSLTMAVLAEGCNDEGRIIRESAGRILWEKYRVDLRGMLGSFESKVEKGNYRDIFMRYDSNPHARIETERGTILIELLYDQAPKTVINFVSLVEKGFYNDRIFHRVIPNFVIQDGCPRGDGWGGPGYTIRCEYNRVPFATGTVGMALSGKDTGGSQFFITLSPQPHLDARYTVFGKVTTGMEVAQQIVRGDRIMRITIEP